MSWKHFFIGEPMPDKNDPKYKERYVREVSAGQRFAQASGISWLARSIQQWGQSHKVAFVAVVFGFVIVCFVFNAVRLFNAYRSSGAPRAIAVERVDSALHQSRHHGDMDF